MSQEHLATYLNDHLAGANSAIELLDHFVAANPEDKAQLEILRSEIEADRQQLKSVMSVAGIAESRIRKAGSWIVEQLSEAKLYADDDAHGPLQRFERLEALSLGIEGKSAMWKALGQAQRTNAAIATVDYDHLIRRAETQRSQVEALRLHAAPLALGNLPATEMK
jgi:hypothetical protein